MIRTLPRIETPPHDGILRAGRAAKVTAPALFLMFTIVLLSAAPARAEQDCHLKLIARLNMTIADNGWVTVPMSVHNHDIHVLVDTGGLFSALTDSTVSAADLHPVPALGQIARIYGGIQIDHYVIAPDVVFGGLKAYQKTFFVFPGFKRFPEIGGLIGPDILSGFDVEFDFANATLSLFSRDHCEGKVVYWTTEPYGRVPFDLDPGLHIILPVTLDGKEEKAIIDSGASSTVASLERMRRDFEGVASSTKDPSASDFDGKSAQYAFKSLSVGEVTVENPEIGLVPDAKSQMGISSPPMLVGLNILRHMHLYIAYSEHVIYVTPASAH